MTSPFLDNFNGEVSTTELSAHTPSGGTAWTKSIGDSSDKFNVRTDGTIAPNKTGAGASATYYCDDQGTANHYVQYQLTNFTTGYAGTLVVFNHVDDDNFHGIRLSGTGATGLQLVERVSGTLTPLISRQGAANCWAKAERSSSTQIRFYYGGTGGSPSWVEETGSPYTTSNFNTETSCGLRTTDNKVGAYADNFEAGAVSSASEGGPALGLMHIVGKPIVAYRHIGKSVGLGKMHIVGKPVTAYRIIAKSVGKGLMLLKGYAIDSVGTGSGLGDGSPAVGRFEFIGKPITHTVHKTKSVGLGKMEFIGYPVSAAAVGGTVAKAVVAGDIIFIGKAISSVGVNWTEQALASDSWSAIAAASDAWSAVANFSATWSALH